VDGFGELAGPPGAAAELTQDPPGLEPGVRALAGRPKSGVRLIGLLLGFWLVLSLVRDPGVRASLVALMARVTRPAASSSAGTPQIHSAFLSCTDPGSAPDTRKMSPSGLAMTCRFIPCLRCLPE
jgi:hypothetical protein